MQQKWTIGLAVLAAGVGGALIGAYAAGGATTGATGSTSETMVTSSGDPSETLAGIRRQWPGTADGDTARLLQMIESLAAVLDAEVAERRYLAEELDALREDVGDILEKMGANPNARSRGTRRARAATDTSTRLREAGMAEEDIAFIHRRLDEYEMAMLDLRDRATREGWSNSSRFSEEMQRVRQQRESLRNDLDESTYDRYLYAMGRPNRVAVSDVIMTSPAADAGLLSGDQLLRYDGTRLFSANDLRRATQGGTRGAPVPIQVLRDGQIVEIYVPTGPLGVRLQTRRENPIGN